MYRILYEEVSSVLAGHVVMWPGNEASGDVVVM